VTQLFKVEALAGHQLREAQAITVADEACVPLALIASQKGESLYRCKSIRRFHDGGDRHGEAMV
jgi:hypothetical protein